MGDLDPNAGVAPSGHPKPPADGEPSTPTPAPGGAGRGTAAKEGASGRPVWGLAGGKGGVGRTLLAANLGIQLARAGHQVVVLDLDLQGGNLHALLGFPRLPQGLGEFLRDPGLRLADVAVDTSINHLRLVGGLQRGVAPADPAALVDRIATQLGDLGAEHVIVDCGSGRSSGTLAAFALANLGILISTPEPAALASACLFTEAHLRRCFDRALPKDTRAALEDLLKAEGVDAARVSFRALMVRIGALDASAREAVAQVARRTRLELLLNMVRDEEDEEAAAVLVTSFRKCFGVDLPIAGLVEYDPSVLQSIHKRRPLSQQFPNTLAMKGITRAAGRLLLTCTQPPAPPLEEWQDLKDLDHYRALEIVPKASTKEVQSAYQILKRAYDPETTHLAPILDQEALRAIQARIEEAYRTLIFLENRVGYDRQLIEHGAVRSDEIRGLHGPLGAEPAAPNRVAGGASRSRPARPHPGPPASTLPHAPSKAVAAMGAPPTGAAPEATPPSGPAGPHPALPTASTTGASLRAERLRLGLTLETISLRTKIRQTYLAAIEEERYDALPPPVFLRGFVREFAACLGLPSDDTARMYLAARARALEPPATATENAGGQGA